MLSSPPLQLDHMAENMSDELTIKIEGNPVTIRKGDITQIRTDAIIVPQYNNRADKGDFRRALFEDARAKDGIMDFYGYVKAHAPLPYGLAYLVESGGGP